MPSKEIELAKSDPGGSTIESAIACVGAEIPPLVVGSSQGGAMAAPSGPHHCPAGIVVTPSTCTTVPFESVAPGAVCACAGAGCAGPCAGCAWHISAAPVPPINVTATITPPTSLAFVQNIMRIAPFIRIETELATTEPADALASTLPANPAGTAACTL